MSVDILRPCDFSPFVAILSNYRLWIFHTQAGPPRIKSIFFMYVWSVDLRKRSGIPQGMASALQLHLRKIRKSLHHLHPLTSCRGTSNLTPVLVTPCYNRNPEHFFPCLIQRQCYYKKYTWHQDQNSGRKAFSFSLGGLGVFLVGCVLYVTSEFREQHKARERNILGECYQLLNTTIPKAKCVGIQDGGSRRSKQYNFLAEAVEVAAPAVVYIESSRSVPTIFGEATAVSSGSGFIVDRNGYVLTNAHVVGNSHHVKVKMVTGRVVTGEVTDTDQVADLALIKLSIPVNEKLPALGFGSLADVRPGEWVVAMGSPLTLENTITAGIVSSVHRPSEQLGLHHRPDMEYVQTDAPITTGNSGGPLVNLDGEVIGVNTMTAGPGISFAIPSDIARNFVENASKTVMRRATAIKYAIGINMLSLTPNMIRLIRFRNLLPKNVTHGVFLAYVWPNGAAAQAGLKQGDVIVRIDGKDIHSTKEVYEMVRTGKRLVMEVVRESHWMTVTVTPEAVR